MSWNRWHRRETGWPWIYISTGYISPPAPGRCPIEIRARLALSFDFCRRVHLSSAISIPSYTYLELHQSALTQMIWASNESNNSQCDPQDLVSCRQRRFQDRRLVIYIEQSQPVPGLPRLPAVTTSIVWRQFAIALHTQEPIMCYWSRMRQAMLNTSHLVLGVGAGHNETSLNRTMIYKKDPSA